MLRFISLGDSSGVGVGAGLDGGHPARLVAHGAGRALRRKHRPHHRGAHHPCGGWQGAVVVIGNIIDLSLAPVAQLATRMLGIGTPEIWSRLQLLNSEVARFDERPDVDIVDLFTVSLSPGVLRRRWLPPFGARLRPLDRSLWRARPGA